MWKRMTHPNVLPLRGVTIAPDRLAFVSNFMSNGTLRRYIREHPEADRLGLVSTVHSVASISRSPPPIAG